jgi:hypothetical protein
METSSVCLIRLEIRFFHLVSNFLKAICFSKIIVSIACLSLLIIVIVSGIVTPFPCKWISNAVKPQMYRCLLVELQ